MNDLQIEYFLAVAENLSFTKTAAEKYVSQPAISRQIATMEEELGVTLFERTYKSVKLTEAGKLFADFYKKQQKDLYSITKQAKDVKKKKSIPLRIGCGSGWTLSDFMPGIIRNLRNSHPDIELSLESYDFHVLPTVLGDDTADVVIALNTSLRDAPSLVMHQLTEIPCVILYSKDHALAAHKDLIPSDFKDETFFIPAPFGTTYIVELVKRFCEPYGFVPKTQSVKSVESLIVSVLNGLGVAIADLWTMESSRAGFLYVPLNSNHTISVAWRKSNDNPALPIFLHELALVFHPGGNCQFDAVL